MIRYLELPSVPQIILDSIPSDYSLYEKKSYYPEANYLWTDTFNLELNQWAQRHIGSDLYFGFQIISGALPVHRDIGTLTKLVYLLDTGGDNVETVFYNDDGTEQYSINIQQHRWHVLQADKLHSVRGIDPNRTRFSITARLFP